MLITFRRFSHTSEPNIHLTCPTRVNYLFGNGGEALGRVLGPHVEDVEFSLQRSGHQLVHVDVFPVKLHAAYLVEKRKELSLFLDIYQNVLNWTQ